MMRKFLVASCCLFSVSSFAKDSVEPPLELAPVSVISTKSIAPPINQEADSKTEFYREELTARGLSNFQDLSKNTANFSMTNTGSGSFSQIITLCSLTNIGIYSNPSDSAKRYPRKIVFVKLMWGNLFDNMKI